MPSTLIICADCEQRSLRGPRTGRAMKQALVCLTQLLQGRKRLQDLQVVRETCLQNCPLGRVCVALSRTGAEPVRHHLSPTDDLKAVAQRLAGRSPRKKTTEEA